MRTDYIFYLLGVVFLNLNIRKEQEIKYYDINFMHEKRTVTNCP